ncbi:hypothetical protein N7462_005014 [Penicillium macrosclerotiorum]|uniref:uncharacterized protein n=1 Tax=Penicillium macrosclerotiorum TaxID=303699 RepID=UPI00254708CF|nr:uncharacterized protein N7462_005014 [Penicillium macrosclerotiorum]KAJ5690622.1 hypothetical protein N7462_005014 [Penicillium macrosclerotiorum]
MSMFRSAAEVSSSDSESDSDSSDQDQLQPSPPARGTSTRSQRLGQLNVSDQPQRELDSGSELGTSTSVEDVATLSQDPLEHHREFMTSALLEFYCQSRAAEILNAQDETGRKFTRQCPEAKYLGSQLYKSKSQFLATHGVLSNGIDKDEFGAARQSYRDNLDLLGRAFFKDMNLNESNPHSPVESGEEMALVTRTFRGEPGSSAGNSAVQFWQNEGQEMTFRKHFSTIDHLEFPRAMLMGPGNLPNQSRPLFGSSPVSMPLFNSPSMPPYNHGSRYSAEFNELKILGRGSFGEVYHVMNHMDGQEYAVKKIPLSQRRLDQLQYGNTNQLEAIMMEIRTLARLEHPNIVRYYAAWAEQVHVMTRLPFEFPTRAGEESSQVSMTNDGITNEFDSSMGVVFEHSQISLADSNKTSPINDQGFPNISRWDSRATSSSHRSKQSSRSALDNDEDIESIPRHSGSLSYGQTSTFGGSDDIFTDGMSQDQSKLRIQRQYRPGQQQPAVILHIQMSLHPISLSSYLNPQVTTQDDDGCSPPRRHCFHLIPSLKLMLEIISGVEYLHSKKIVHRDLKPANIFLCAPEKHALQVCPSCSSDSISSAQFSRPRIGDFGLVADISRLEAPENGIMTPYHEGPKIQRVVGTEFYRPPVNMNGSDALGYFDQYTIDEKLDVYALGVILFELIYRLNTKMERQFVLNDLTRSISFPSDFANKIDQGNARWDSGISVAETLMACIREMLTPKSRQRWTCQEVKDNLRPIYKFMKRQQEKSE